MEDWTVTVRQNGMSEWERERQKHNEQCKSIRNRLEREQEEHRWLQAEIAVNASIALLFSVAVGFALLVTFGIAWFVRLVIGG